LPSCCTTAADAGPLPLHQRLRELMQRYNINEYAASVRLHAVRGG
jgi:hypothetical protein